MSKSRPLCPAGFCQQMTELVRAGRSPAQFSRDFDCTAQSIANRVNQANVDEGPAGSSGLNIAEREELTRLRRPVRQLQTERDIPAKAAVWYADHDIKTFTTSLSS